MRVARDLIAVAVAVAACLAVAGAASAKAPYITHVNGYPSSYVDDELCGFPVFVNGTDTFTEQDFSDGRIVFHDVFSGTASANGVTLNKFEDATIIWGTDGSTTWKGLAEGYSYPHGRVITQDTGVIVFDADGNVVSERGPHPINDGPGAAAVCAILSGA